MIPIALLQKVVRIHNFSRYDPDGWLRCTPSKKARSISENNAPSLASAASDSLHPIGPGMIPIPLVEGKGAPNLLPATLVLGILLWIFTTTGGQQIFVNEVLSEAYDSQAEHFLRGDLA